MNRNFIAILLVIALAATFTACKTSEKNYREAYEKVIQKKNADADPELDDLIKGDYYDTGRRRTYTVNGDTLKTSVLIVSKNTVPGTDSIPLQQFNVVVSEFRQLFNAKALAESLQGMGYDAIVVNDNKPTYYVVAATTDMTAEALRLLKEIAADRRIPMQKQCPWVLQVAQMMR